MADPHTERTTILAGAWRWWADTLQAMDEPAWHRSTRLEGWDVAALVAHHSTLVHGFGRLVAHPVDGGGGTKSAVQMLRTFNEPGGLATTMATAVEQTARQRAGSLSPAELIAVFAQTAPEVVDAMGAAATAVVDYFGHGTMPIAEAASIAILEAVVHGLDLCAALDVDGSSLPDDAMHETVALLAAMADPVEFITVATGRSDTRVLPVLR